MNSIQSIGIDENCSNLIDNLFQLELIEERDIQKFENYDDLDLCRKATALFKKQGSVNDYNASQTLIEDIRDEAKARKKGYSHLVLGDTGNVYLASELDTLKFFVARNYADKAVVLFEDEQVERFLKEKGKTLLQSIKNKELRAKVVSAVENLVTANRNSYPEALKQIGKKNKRAAGKSKLRTRVKFPGATMPASDINIVRDFSKYPGHRQAKHGENSGEEFRDNLLLPAFKKSGKITVDLTGTVGLGSGFLEEAFGGLVRLGIKLTRENLIITASAEEFEEVWSYIDQATQKIKLAREK